MAAIWGKVCGWRMRYSRVLFWSVDIATVLPCFGLVSQNIDLHFSFNDLGIHTVGV